MRTCMTLLLKVKADYLLVYLAKHNQGSDWSHITHAEKVCTVFRYALITRIHYVTHLTHCLTGKLPGKRCSQVGCRVNLVVK